MAVTPGFERNSLPPSREQRRTYYGWLLMLLTLSFVIIALWLPFGFSLTALIEEWGIIGTYTTRGLFFIADTASPLAAHASRPLTVFPHSVAFYLDNNSFNYWHLVLMLSFLIKGFCFGFLIRKATGSLQWAFLAAILVVLYPADTMQMTFRGLHINWALSLQLLASYFFVLAFQAKPLIRYFVFSALAVIFNFAAICMYEAAIPLLMLPFLIIYAEHGIRGTYSLLWSRKLLVIAWVSTLAIYLVYLHNLTPAIKTYQNTLIGGRSLWALITQTPYSKLFSVGVLRALLGSWFDAFGMLFKEFGLYGYLYLALILSSIYGLFLFTRTASLKEHEDNNEARASLLRLAVAGFLLLILGYSTFLYLPSYIATTQRTYLFASPGAVMVWLVPLMLIAKHSRKIAISLSFLLIGLGLAAQLFQFRHYVQISMIQRSLLKAIVENYDGRKDKTLLVLDKTNQLNYTWMFLTPNLQGALSYFYNHSLNQILVCRSPGEGWQLYDTHRSGSCLEHEDNWSFVYPEIYSGIENKTPHPVQVVPKKDLYIVTIEPDGSVIADPKMDSYRQDLRHGQSLSSLRYRNILADNTWLPHFTKIWKAPTPDRFQWDFGDWWGLDIPIPGNGWDEAGWMVNSFHHKALAAKIAQDANLLFNLRPSADVYQLRVTLANIINDNIRNTLKMRINDHDIAFRWLDFNPKAIIPNNIDVVATIPRQDLLSGVNSLVFSSDIVKEYYGLSFQVVSINLSPLHSAAANTVNSEKKDKI
ncbi:hypothetical protein Lnau_0304 [Legionella nautarum]|uniref:Transmembrane protein n=1 Tax=Legionella nautarum TaxID=45070 RepID=A0A0W0X3H6_9GAMM|nr:hypothetical protein [Legionella nautarum]KTD39105.1 hypothetical protein Lnau_0304 [Legionella nautarum]